MPTSTLITRRVREVLTRSWAPWVVLLTAQLATQTLVANAVKFTFAGGEVRVALESGWLPRAAKRMGAAALLLRVEDNGVGIPADAAARPRQAAA